MVGHIECTSLITQIANGLCVLSWAQISYIAAPRLKINEAYLVQGHTLKRGPDGSVIFFFSGYVNETSIPNSGLHLYKRQSLAFELQPMEVPPQE